MKITNLTVSAIFLGFVEPFGINLPASGTITILDSYGSNTSLRALADSTPPIIRIDSYSASSSEIDAYIGSAEFNTYAQGLFNISSWVSVGSVTKGTGYALISTIADTYNLLIENTLQFKFDSLYTVSVVLSNTYYSLAGLISALNGDTTFAKYAVASVDSTHYLKITSKATGSNSKVECLKGDLGLTTIVAATGTVAEVTITAKNPCGYGIYGLPLAVKLYSHATNPVISTQFHIQRVTIGTSSTINLAEVASITGDNGVLKFEIGSDDTITEVCYVDIVIPSDYFLAVKPSSRLSI